MSALPLNPYSGPRYFLVNLLASVVASVVALRFDIPTFDREEDGPGEPRAVFVDQVRGVSMWDTALFRDPIGSQGDDEEGRVWGYLCGWRWQVYYRARKAR